jgi:hypothetical protein
MLEDLDLCVFCLLFSVSSIELTFCPTDCYNADRHVSVRLGRNAVIQACAFLYSFLSLLAVLIFPVPALPPPSAPFPSYDCRHVFVVVGASDESSESGRSRRRVERGMG